MLAGGGGLAAEHASQLSHATLFIQASDFRNGAAALDLFGGQKMRASRSGDLRQVGNAEDLPLLSDLAHFLRDGIGRFSTHIGIHLVEHQDRNPVFRSEHSFESEHDASQFTGGGDRAERARRLAGIRGKLEFDSV